MTLEEIEKLEKPAIIKQWTEHLAQMKFLTNEAICQYQIQQYSVAQLKYDELIKHLLSMLDFVNLLQKTKPDEIVEMNPADNLFKKNSQKKFITEIIMEISNSYTNFGNCLLFQYEPKINKPTHAYLTAIQWDNSNHYAKNNILHCMDVVSAHLAAAMVRRKRTPQIEAWARNQNLGYDELKHRNLELAYRYYNNAINIFPNEAVSWHGLGLSLCQNKTDEAIDCWMKVLELEPNYNFELRYTVQFAD